MSAARRTERARKRARRARRRAEADQRLAAALEATRKTREERLERLGPFVEMYGEGSALTCAIDRLMLDHRVPVVACVDVLDEGAVRPSDAALSELLAVTLRP